MDSHPKVEVTKEGEHDAELMAELQREVARNNEAVRLVKEKELQALAARDRAADSQRRMQAMMERYEDMKQKLYWTRLTLDQTASQINKHDIRRSEQIRETVARLKEKAENCSEILRKRRERETKNVSNILSGNTTEIDQIITVADDDDGGSLTEAEKMLLLMCQKEALSNIVETEGVTEILMKEQTQHSVQTDHQLLADSKPLKEPSINITAEKETLNTITDHLSDTTTINTLATSDIRQEISIIEKREESDHEQGNEELNKHETDVGGEPKMEDSLNLLDEVVPKVPPTAKVDGAETSEEMEDSLNIVDEVVHKVPPTAKVDGAEASEDFDLKDITKDLNETVTNIEAKCAGVREELGQMAMSEQYMRTKQAQLLAKRREKEAEKAVELAAKKEQEAQEMRRKVANMMKLLEERKNKLKVTENVLEKRTNVVDKVNKVLDSKLRRADFVEKQRLECIVFDKSHKKSDTNKQQENTDQHASTSDEQELEESKKSEDEECKATDDDKV